MNTHARKILLELLAVPTSPFNEQYVAGYIRRWVDGRRGLALAADVFGNLIVRLRRGRTARRPLVFSAHMDHPGFEAEGMVRSRLRAIWRGGVAPEYFRQAPVRFYSENRWVRGTVVSTRVRKDERGRRRVSSAMIEVDRPVAPGSIGMWDFPDPVIRGQRVHARACDDIAGLAAVLSAFDRLWDGRGAVDIYATFTRAEEVGFAGAIALSRNGLLPRGARIVAVEISSEIPGVNMGAGPILRVGDRTAIFTPGLTAFCRHVAEDLANQDRTFTFQRKLMDGGTCESAAFCEYGLEATGLCLALGNYHNMDVQRRRLAPEYIDLNDYEKLVQWFAALATSKRPYKSEGDPAFRETLDKLDAEYTPLLRETAGRVLNAGASGALTRRGKAERPR
ncbi:MAG: hypothetical protein AMXMBFR13_46930 [Phycisphaerae bacterium]